MPKATNDVPVTREEIAEALNGYQWFIDWAFDEIKRAIKQGPTKLILDNILGRIRFPHSTPLQAAFDIAHRFHMEEIHRKHGQEIADDVDQNILDDLRAANETVLENTKCENPAGFISLPSDFEEVFVKELVSRGMSEAEAVATVDLVKLMVGPHTMSTEELVQLPPVDGSHGKMCEMEYRPVSPPAEQKRGKWSWVCRTLKRTLPK